MGTINEQPRVSDVVLWETGRDIEYVREQVTVASGTAACKIGQVMAVVNGKWTQLDPGASDGSNIVAGVLIGQPFSAQLAADAQATVISRGPAVVKSSGLQWPAGITDPQKAAAIAGLVAIGILVRDDYGV